MRKKFHKWEDLVEAKSHSEGDACVPWNQPLPKNPPDPMAIID